MDTAKELLADPTKSVSDVAYALGYQYPPVSYTHLTLPTTPYV